MTGKRIILASLFLLTTACQPQNNDAEEQQTAEGQAGGYAASELEAPEDIAEHLAQLCTNIPDVDRATAIVIGPYALVGIDVKGDIDQSEVGAIKYQAAEALADDPHGAAAAVTADPDIMQRIEEMRDEMGQGRPIAAIANELGDIIGRIIPIVPGDEHRRGEDPEEVNDKRMSSEEEKQLNDIQNEQSKGEMKRSGSNR
ncbi:sporulation lipoprotein, YhcN/YlaJ family [Evansella caseinilytica]|uniref:Sporulation lipoprotein, YhcN/YlaJ family n=1 Tax=Evansella caseinilytica TaxID=1503961 RepID=A0A1H3MNP0_9BACI|nr:YhcN/YlaJ family sporulation lipoprotein [Evansella caseinilytica]SDY77709.1 sporulation lipoprotein, YhcN/YlaJ family [Evansella caseinilytica]